MTDSDQVTFQDENALVKRLRSGDLTAFEELARTLSGRYVQLVERMCGNRQDAEEIVNDAAFKIISKIETFDSSRRKSFWNWVYQIVQNQAIDHHRRQERKPLQKATGFDDILNLDKVLYANAPVLSGSVDATEEHISPKIAALHRGLGRLSERDRAIIEGHFFNMFTDEEIASTLSTNPDHMRKYRSRALGRLRIILSDEPEFADKAGSSERTPS